ncbi:MAG TPA: hypothetical protein GX699_01230 [Firmicutes bacterium]|nr:hypothetical protein [Bacillota bacterium]
MMHCPLCNSVDTGKVGTGQYYCWNCLVEFSVQGSGAYTAYYVDEDGTLVALGDLVQHSGVPAENFLG